MTTITPTERAVIRHLSLSEPMSGPGLFARAMLPEFDYCDALSALQRGQLVSEAPIRAKGRFTGQRGYILTPAGADLCEAMERERAELNAIAAQATREHGEPDEPLTAEDQAMIDAAWEKHKAAGPCDRPPAGWYCTRGYGHGGPCAAREDGDALIAHAMQSPAAEAANAMLAAANAGYDDAIDRLAAPRFFSPPVKPSLWARVKARLGLAA